VGIEMDRILVMVNDVQLLKRLHLSNQKWLQASLAYIEKKYGIDYKQKLLENLRKFDK
jgi:hypothetical protein